MVCPFSPVANIYILTHCAFTFGSLTTKSGTRFRFAFNQRGILLGSLLILVISGRKVSLQVSLKNVNANTASPNNDHVKL
jgi:hypothetical protein